MRADLQTRVPPATADGAAELGFLASLAQTGRFAEAEMHARALLVRLPTSGPAWRYLGWALWMQGKDAVAALQRTVELLPDDADAHGNLGTALRARGRAAEAVKCYERALEIRPRFAEALNNIAGAYRDLDRLDDAIAGYRRALQVVPDFAVAHCNLGHVLRAVGRFEESRRHYQRAVEIHPRFTEAHTGVGHVLQDLGRLEEALAHHLQALELDPGSAESHRNLGNVYLDLWRICDAERSFRRALSIDPQFAQAHDKLGAALRLNGHAADAEASCRRALEIRPDLVDGLISLGQLLSDKGEFTAAEEVLRRALALEPNCADACAGIAGLRKMSALDAAWLADAERIAAVPLSARREAKLRFAIGKYLDDVGDYARAFASYRRANELCARGPQYDPRQVEQEFTRIKTTFDLAWLGRTRAACASERPIFVVGMPRSGTTLTEQILASHPAVHGAGEVAFWVAAVKKYSSVAPADGEAAELLHSLASDYVSVLQGRSADALRVVDKMPANFQALGLMHGALPNARIIHVVRDPIDTCLSIYFQDFNATHTYANDLRNLAHYYSEYRRLMAHWRSSLPAAAMLEVRYEDLVDDPEGWSRRMVQFAGLPWDERCLDVSGSAPGDRSILTFSRWQARQPIHKSSKQRWRNYRDFVGPLLELGDERELRAWR